MKKLALSFLCLLMSGPIFAASKATDYKSVSCTIENSQGNLFFTAKPLMAIATEAGEARFIQIRHVTENEEIQYQLLIEPGLDSETVVVLQNFKVNSEEVSIETQSALVSKLEIQQGAWTARCEVIK